MSEELKPSKPAVALIMQIVGWITIVIGFLFAANNFTSQGDGPLAGFVAVGSGLTFVGFGIVIDKVSRIEHHLRPKPDLSSETSKADAAVVSLNPTSQS